MFSPFVLGDLKLKNQLIMSAKPIGFSDVNEWTMFYLARAKENVSAIVFPVSEILEKDDIVVKNCLEQLQELDCVPLLELDVKTFKEKSNWIVDIGFSGIVLEQSSALCDLEMIANMEQSLCILVSIGDINEGVVSWLKKYENNIHGVVVDFENNELFLEKTLLEIEALKNTWKLPILCSFAHTGTEDVLSLLQKDMFDGILIWKPLLCDTKFVSKLLENKPYYLCQECGHCQMNLPVVCPYHPEVGSEFFESQRRKIATRKEFCICGDGIVALYAAKKAAQRGFPVTICKKQENSSQIQSEKLGVYKKALLDELNDLGVAEEEISGDMGAFLRERKPYFSIFLLEDAEDTSWEEAMFTLLDDRLSCGKFVEAKTVEQLEETLVEVYHFFKQFYLV